MPVNLVSEEDLRAVLRPYQVDPQKFEAAVRKWIADDSREQMIDPWVGFSPFLRASAACLPLSMLGCKGTLAAAKITPTSVGAKLLGYLAFPAVSLFVLLGATVLSVLKIRALRSQNVALSGQIAQDQEIRLWWRAHKWGVGVVFFISLALGLFGASWLLFLFYILSFGTLLYVIATLSKLGIGNRFVIGSSCAQGLMFLGQISAFSGVGAGEIHFLDQSLIPAVFFGGTLVIATLLLLSPIHAAPKTKNPQGAFRLAGPGGPIAITLMGLIVLPLIAWMVYPTFWKITPPRIQNYVESFDHAPFSSVDWQKWEIPASWVLQSKRDPDFSKPRQLLAKEIAGEQNPYILSSASRVGLLTADQIGQIKSYKTMRHWMVASTPNLKPQMLNSLEQHAWVIYAAALCDDLSTAERDILEQRLHATLQTLFDESYLTLVELLRVTQLLDLIQRPVKPDQYRAKMHNALQEFHSRSSGGFELAGGFRKYRKYLVDRKNTWMQFLIGAEMPGDPVSTSHAIELMEIYGVPDGLDLNWVRSFLRPIWSGDPDRKWVAAVTLDRLNRLPDAPHPIWIEYLYYERTLLAAAVLVGLCILATANSPILKTESATTAE